VILSMTSSCSGRLMNSLEPITRGRVVRLEQ
jgi:hypothetical protein